MRQNMKRLVSSLVVAGICTYASVRLSLFLILFSSGEIVDLGDHFLCLAMCVPCSVFVVNEICQRIKMGALIDNAVVGYSLAVFFWSAALVLWLRFTGSMWPLHGTGTLRYDVIYGVLVSVPGIVMTVWQTYLFQRKSEGFH